MSRVNLFFLLGKGASTTSRPCCPALEELQKRKAYTKRWGKQGGTTKQRCGTVDSSEIRPTQPGIRKKQL